MITPIRALVLAVLVSVFAFSIPAFSYAASSSVYLRIDSADDDINNPRLIPVDRTSSTEGVEVFSFQLEAHGDQDLTVKRLQIQLSSTETGDRDPSDYVSKLYLSVDGDEIGSAVVSKTDAPNGADFVTFTGLDITIEDDEAVDVMLTADFLPLKENYEGHQVGFGILQSSALGTWIVEDESGNRLARTSIKDEAWAGQHSLRTAGPILQYVSDNATMSDDGTFAQFALEFDVTAFGSDIYILNSASPEKDDGILYEVRRSDDYVSNTSSFIMSRAPESGKYFRIDEAETERFTLIVQVSPSEAGVYNMRAKMLAYSLSASPATLPLVPLSEEFSTDSIVIGTPAGYGTFRVYKDGVLTTERTERKNLATVMCELTITQIKQTSPQTAIRCTWNDEVIGEYTPPVTKKGTYIGYMDGKQFIRTENITEPAALANCKLNHKNNPSRTVRCTWNDKEIYNKGPILSAAITTITKTDSPLPVISGTASLSSVGLSITGPSGDKAYGSGKIAVQNGKWSHTVTTALPNGKYTANLYSPENRPIAGKVFTIAAASTTPSCTLAISPNVVMLGQTFTATWTSKNATKAALSHGGGTVAVNGSKTMGIATEGDYLVTLTVTGPTGSAKCTATVAVTPLVGASVTFNKNLLTSTSPTPRIGGSAVNLTSIYITGQLTTNSKVTFTSAVAKVTNGKWAVTLPKLVNGTYTIGAIGPGYQKVGEATLVVNAATSTASSTQARLHPSMLGDLIAGVGMVLQEIPREFLAIFTRG